MPDDDTYTDDDLGDSPSGLTRKHLVYALGVFALATVALSAYARAKRRPPAATFETMLSDPGDWQASLEHLASVWDVRFAGIDERINAIGAQLAALAEPSKPVLSTGNGAAATSMPPPAFVEPVAAAPTVTVVADDLGTPPAPAAVSAMPDAVDA